MTAITQPSAPSEAQVTGIKRGQTRFPSYDASVLGAAGYWYPAMLSRQLRSKPLAIPCDGLLLTLPEIRAWIERVDAQLPGSRPDHLFPSYGRSQDFARPHIEVHDAYHYVVVERGEELRRDTTIDLNELLYWVFQSITHDMASSYAAARHPPANGFRRAMFRRQLQLLGFLDAGWSARRRAEIMATLTAHPFTDGGPANID